VARASSRVQTKRYSGLRFREGEGKEGRSKTKAFIIDIREPKSYLCR
jgi:hypothetical protein